MKLDLNVASKLPESIKKFYFKNDQIKKKDQEQFF